MDRTTSPDRPDRRSFVALGAAAAAPLLVAGTAAADNPGSGGGNATPNLYPNWNAKQFQAIQRHENAHVDAVIALIQQIGGTPRPEPTFKGITAANYKVFGTLSQTFENTGAGANRAIAPVIYSKTVLAAAGSIAQMEARHCGFLNFLFNKTQTTDVFGNEQQFEQPLTQDQVRALASPFIQSLNGGPPAAFNATPSAANDIAILNFALVLEYLERDFYNINVPKFFPS